MKSHLFIILTLFLAPFPFLTIQDVFAGDFDSNLCENVTRDRALPILQAHPPTNEGIRSALPQLKTAFGDHVAILDHPLRLDKIDFGGGMIVDVIVGAGGPGPRWDWMVECECGTGICSNANNTGPGTASGSFNQRTNPIVPSEGLPGFGQLIAAIFTWSLNILGIVVFVQIFYAGFKWFTAAGNTAKVGEARSQITNAITGALILLAAYIILYTLNPDLVGGTFTLPGTGTTQQQP